MRILTTRHGIYTLLLIMLFAFGGCTIKLISPYDETLDQGITALQKSTESYLIGLESIDTFPACSYKENMQFFLDAKVELSSIKVRASAMPKNNLTVKQLDLLADSLDSLEALQKIKDKKSACLSKQEIKPLRDAFNISYTAILKLELAKKRGEE